MVIWGVIAKQYTKRIHSPKQLFTRFFLITSRFKTTLPLKQMELDFCLSSQSSSVSFTNISHKVSPSFLHSKVEIRYESIKNGFFCLVSDHSSELVF